MFDNILVYFNLGCKVLPGIFTLGLFDNSGYSIVAVTASGDKVVIHNEFSKQPLSRYFSNRLELSLMGNRSNNYLSITDKIKSILTIRITNMKNYLPPVLHRKEQTIFDSSFMDDDEAPRDILVIGCESTLLVYDVKMNLDIYYTKLTTSINSLIPILSMKEDNEVNESNAVICGSSSGIITLELDSSGITDNNSTLFPTGDRIKTMIAGSLKEINVIIIGSERGRITVYDVVANGKYVNKAIFEESSSIACLCAINTSDSSSDQSDLMLDHIGYGTSSGTIGVLRIMNHIDATSTIDRDDIMIERLWMMKMKDEPLCMVLYDINGDGIDELIVGYKNGRIEVREVFTGEMKDKMRLEKNSRLAGMCVGDYCQDDSSILLICTIEGTVIGYKPREQLTKQNLINYNAQSTTINSNFDNDRLFDTSIETSSRINDSGKVASNLNDAYSNEDNIYEGQNPTLLEALRNRLIINENLKSRNQEYKLNLQDQLQASSKRDLSILQEEIYLHVKYDISNSCIALIINLRSDLFGFKLLLLEDEKKNLFPNGYMIAVAPDRNDILMQELETTIKANDDIECDLDITIVVETKSNDQETNLCIKKSIFLPTFSMYALLDTDEDWPIKDKLKVVIDLPDIHYTKIWKWMEEKFLCLQISSDRPSSCIKHSDCSIDLRLIDLNDAKRKPYGSESTTIAETTDTHETFNKSSSDRCLSRIEFSSRSKELSIESESMAFLSSVVRSLVIDYLGYNKYDTRPNIGSAIIDLNVKNSLAKQLKETDNKISAEFAETSKNLRSLSEQLEMANDMFEYQTSMEILNDLMKMRTDMSNLSKIRITNYRKQQNIKDQITLLSEQISIVNNWIQ